MTYSGIDPESLRFATALRNAVQDYGPQDRAAAQVNAIDMIGVASAGFRRPELARLMTSGLVDPQTTHSGLLLGHPLRCRPHEAALINAMAGHIDDFDDDEAKISISHVTVPSLAAALSVAGLAQQSGLAISGAKVLDAYTAGVATMVALGEVLNPAHYETGWHASATHGVFGAAMAAGHMLDLSVDELAIALSFAVTAASGSRSAFGSDAKPLQLAAATSAGVQAVMLVRAGLTANTSLFSHMGLVPLYRGNPDRIEAAIARLSGRPFVDPGVTIKAWPCCTATHPAIEAAQRLRAKGGPDLWRRIRTIEVSVGREVPRILIHSNPQTALEAKFSLEFTTAAGLILPDVGLDAFEDSVVQDPAIRRLISCCAMIGVQDQDDLFLTRTVVTLDDGSQMTEIVVAAEGSPERPASTDTLQRKFLGTCQGDGPRAWNLLAGMADTRDWPGFEAELLPLLRAA